MKLRLATRIIFPFTLLTLALLAAAAWFSYRSGSAILRQAATSEMVALAIEKEAAVNRWFEERRKDIRHFAIDSQVRALAERLIASEPGSPAAQVAHAGLLQEFKAFTEEAGLAFAEVFLMAPEDGRVLVSTQAAEEGKSKAGNDYFQQGRLALHLQTAFLSSTTGTPRITGGVPVRTPDGRLVAVVGIRMDLAPLEVITQRRSGLQETVDAFLLNAERLPLTQPRFLREPVVLRRKLDTAAVRACAERKSGVMVAPDYRRVPSIAVYRWNATHQVGLIVKVDVDEALAPVRAFGWSVFQIGAASLPATIMIAWWLARSITRPLAELQASVERFGVAEKAESDEPHASDEVGHLVREFKLMSARVAERTAQLTQSAERLRAENAERRQVEEALRQSEEKFRQIAANIADVIWMTTPDMQRILYVSPAYETIWGRTLESLQADPRQWLDAILPGDREKALAEMSSLGTATPRFSVEFRIQRPDGSCRWVLDRGFQVADDSGRLVCNTGIVTDITERKRAELRLTALSSLGQKLSAAHTARESGEIIVDIADQLFTWDASTLDLYSAEHDRMHHVLNTDTIDGRRVNVPPMRDQAPPTPRARRVLEQGAQLILRDEPHDLPEGVPFGDRARPSASIMLVPIRERAKAIGVLSIQSYTPRAYTAEDLQVLQSLADHCGGALLRIRADEALRDSEERFRNLAENTSDWIWEIDEQGKYSYASPRLRDLLGYEPADVLGRSPFDLMTPEEAARVGPAFARLVADRRPFQALENVNLHRDGHRVVLETSGVPFFDVSGAWRGYRGIDRDITARKQSEAMLAETNRELVILSRRAGMAEVATSVLHNVGNVLTSVNVSAEIVAAHISRPRAEGLKRVAGLLREHAQDLPGFLTRHPQGRALPDYLLKLAASLAEPPQPLLQELHALRKNVEHIKEIVALQQNLARGFGVQDCVSVTELVRDAVRIHASGLARHRVRLVEAFLDVPPVTTDRHAVLQILVNLVSNGKYALAAVAGERQLTVAVTPEGNAAVRIEIRDNGIGIPPENLSRIFQHGFTTRKDGHGFGLHSGALAAKQLGGALTARSDGPGQGAVFTLLLPLQPPTQT